MSESAPEVRVVEGDNLGVLRGLSDGIAQLIYLDPPFNTGRKQGRAIQSADRVQEVPRAPHAASAESRDLDGGTAEKFLQTVPLKAGADRVSGFRGTHYERLRGDLRTYDDRFDDYWGFLEPRLQECWRLLDNTGTLYLHLDYRESHYAKVLMDAMFGRDRFLNELVWAYDYGAKSKRRWPTKHDTILVYVKDPSAYWFDSETVDREPYMAPGLVTPEKAARGKLPTDVWWHTIVPTSGREKTGYPTQKPEGILRRIIQASSRPGDLVLDPFAGSGTTGAVASALGRRALLIDENPEALAVMRTRIPHADFTTNR